MSEYQESFELLYEYVNNNFKTDMSYRECIDTINAFSSFLNKYKYVLEIDIIIELLQKYPGLYACAKVIYEKNIEAINDGKLFKLFKRKIYTDMIYAYCMENNIEINDENEEYNIEDNPYDKRTEEELEEDYYKNNKALNGLDIYYNSFKGTRLLTREEEQDLARRYHAGDEDAKNELIINNLRLVVNKAKEYQGRGVGLEDLIGYGNIGLLKAVEKYNPELGFKFGTYAVWWIRQSITREIGNTSTTVRIPIYLNNEVSKYNKAEERLSKELDRQPTEEEISKDLNISLEKIGKIKRAMLSKTLSLNSLVSEDGDAEVGDMIADNNVDVEEEVFSKMLIEDIQALLDTNYSHLSEREYNIMCYRFGLCNHEKKTLEEIGKMYDLTRERIRQIEEKAISKLKATEDAEHFDAYMYYPEETTKKLRRHRASVINRYGGYNGEINYHQNGKTVYGYFEKNTRDEIHLMIDRLTIYEKHLFYKRYGSNLDVIYKSELTNEEKTIFYGKVFPRMKQLLDEIHRENVLRRNTQSMSESFRNSIKEKLEEEQKRISELAKGLAYSRKDIMFLKQAKSNMDPIIYQKMVQLIDLIRMNRDYNKINIRELAIIILSLGYINNRHYANNEISSLLSIPYDTVILLEKKVLNEYRNIVSELDNQTGKRYILE